MAKRFINTNLFDDPWFMDLSLSGKIFWVYCITKCNHAGILELNPKLAQFQTGIKNIRTVIEELGNRIERVREQYYFIRKFIFYQYPNFPQSTVRQQASAIKILTDFELFDPSTQTLIKELRNHSEPIPVNVVEDVAINIPFSDFYNL